MAEENKNTERPSSKYDFRKPIANKYDFRKEDDAEDETIVKEEKKGWRGIAVAALAAVICVGVAVYAWHNSQNSSDASLTSSEIPEAQVAKTSKEQAASPHDATESLTEPTYSESQNKVSENTAAVTNDDVVPASSERNGDEQVAVDRASKKDVDHEKAVANTSTKGISQTTTGETDIEKMALLVIRGNYGNGEQRKRMLNERYEAIQKRVNDIYREKEGL